TASARVAGGRVELATIDASGSSGLAPLPSEPLPPDLWVVVSSEPDARSPSAVGWPAGPQPTTFDVPEVMLLDGAPQRELQESRWRLRVRWVTALYAALAALLTVALFVHR